MATGASASFFTLVELDSDSSLARAMFGSKMKAVCTSTSCALAVGYFVNPLAGITFELFFYPACWLKSKQVERTIKKLIETEPPGSKHEIEYPMGSGEWHPITLPKKQEYDFSCYDNVRVAY